MNTDNKVGDRSGTRKVGLSCAECRRSKLKCDRMFPCQSCIRRGCAGICPEGTLAATKGNKVLMAHAQRLSEQVKRLTARVHELESILGQPLSEDQGAVSREEDDYDGVTEEVSEAIGSLSIGMNGQARYHGETAGSEYLQDLLPLTEEVPATRQLDLPPEVVDLLNAFPFGLKDTPYTKHVFRPYLPSKDKAFQVTGLYYGNASWMYDPIPYHEFLTTVLEPLYGVSGYPDLDAIHSHRLSVFFIVMANGIIYEGDVMAPANADMYLALARGALSVDSLLQEVTCATVQALFLITRFIYASDRSSNEERWVLAGLCARLGQTLGLQRDSAGWNLPADEVQRRRRLFWELFVWESWSSLVNGRAPSLMIQHTDCRFPDDLYSTLSSTGENQPGWHAWKFRYSASCLSVSVMHVFSTKSPSYATFLELDKKIRKFPVSGQLRPPVRNADSTTAWSTDPVLAMQQYSVWCIKESNLLLIHRSYFAQAIREEAANPLAHRYAPSVLATFRSACRLISGLRTLYPMFPRITGQTWYLWSGVYSACIVLGALVVESPGCSLSRDALHELERTLPMYEEGSRVCRPIATLPTLQKLCHRAGAAYSSFVAGLDRGSSQENPDKPDELAILGGRKSVIVNTSPNSPSYRAARHPIGDGANSPGSHTGAAEMLLEYYEELGNPSFEIGHSQDYSTLPGDDVNISRRYANDPFPDKTAPPISDGAQESDSRNFASPRSSLQGELHGPFDHAQVRGRSLGNQPIWNSPYQSLQRSQELVEAAPSPQDLSGIYYPYDPSVSLEQGHQYGYAAEPTQDDIWRNFMREFGGT